MANVTMDVKEINMESILTAMGITGGSTDVVLHKVACIVLECGEGSVVYRKAAGLDDKWMAISTTEGTKLVDTKEIFLNMVTIHNKGGKVRFFNC